MHLTEGDLRAFLDNQVDPGQSRSIQQHLAACSSCQDVLAGLSRRAADTHQHLQTLSPSGVIPSWALARRQLQNGFPMKENTSMMQKIFSRRYRPAWAVAVVLVLLVASLTIPQVRAIANSFLGLLRVQKIAVIQVNLQRLPNQLGSSSQLEAIFTDYVKVEEKGELLEAGSVAEASDLAGITVRLPSSLGQWDSLVVQPGATMTFDVRVDLLQSVLEEIGRTDIQIPAELDGAQVAVDIPNGVAAMYGNCNYDVEQARQHGFDPDDPNIPLLPECTTLVQMSSPTIAAPPGLNIEAIGEAYLQLLGMPLQEAQSFAKNVDWATTFVIPIPRNGTNYQDVAVDGVTGALITQALKDRESQYLLIWVKGGIVYALTGPGSVSDALEIAGSLE